MKFDPLSFGWFNLYLDPFFEEIMNLNTKMPIFSSSTCYTKKVIGTPGESQVTCSKLNCSACI
jgi:hypothetical protein